MKVWRLALAILAGLGFAEVATKPELFLVYVFCVSTFLITLGASWGADSVYASTLEQMERERSRQRALGRLRTEDECEDSDPRVPRHD
jgi:hypothetical protein